MPRKFSFFLSPQFLPIFFLLLAMPFCIRAEDSIPKKDTLDFYMKIRKAAYKHKFTILLYHAIFVDPAPRKYNVQPLSDKQRKEDPLLKFRGKPIRSVRVEVLDPFGYSVNDATRKGTNPLQKLGNHYHVTTRHRIIRNMLLFKANETLDPLKIRESERLLREALFVSDARIYVENDSVADQDSVDVHVLAQDKWTLDAIGTFTPRSANVTLRERNILGSGQRFEQNLQGNLNHTFQLSGLYSVPNISKSYVSSNVFYTKTNDLLLTGFSLERAFYSPLSHWAGGFWGAQSWNYYRYTDSIAGPQTTELNSYSTDSWIGRSINIKTYKRINRRVSNIIVALRYIQTHYQQRPSFEIDTAKLYGHINQYIGSAGFSVSKYYKDQYIFRFGANEDIPEGLITQVLYGILYKEKSQVRYYTGFDVSRGKHFDHFGYLSGYATYGVYFEKGLPDNTTLNLGSIYFTDLWRNNKWYFRQFVYLKYVSGKNKPYNERIILRPDELYGFSSGSLNGCCKAIVNLEGVTYAPYNLIGFHFAPLTLLGFGMIQDNDRELLKGAVYQSYALGLLIRNENLLNSSFRLVLGVYPNQPGEAKKLKFNPSISFTVKTRSFATTRPAVVVYN